MKYRRSSHWDLHSSSFAQQGMKNLNHTAKIEKDRVSSELYSKVWVLSWKLKTHQTGNDRLCNQILWICFDEYFKGNNDVEWSALVHCISILHSLFHFPHTHFKHNILCSYWYLLTDTLHRWKQIMCSAEEQSALKFYFMICF